MQRLIRTIVLGSAFIACIVLNGCKKIFLPEIITEETGYYLTSCQASLWGRTISEGGSRISERGICMSTNMNDSFTCNVAAVVDKGDKLFVCIVTSLLPNTTYYYKAYAINPAGTAYGELKSFTTKPATTLTITTQAYATSPTSALAKGKTASGWCSSYMERGICWSTNPNPDITGNKIIGGAESDSFSVNLTGLTASTDYYVRAYSSSIAGTSYGNQIVVQTFDINSVQDIDGNSYSQITIGNQVWMKENLRTTKYRDGSQINKVLGAGRWFSNPTAPSYGEYFTNSTDVLKYGRIYNVYAVLDDRKLCPAGWHVPSESEWTTLIAYLGGSSIAGGKLKSISEWTIPNTGATDESGFSANPGSYPVKKTGQNGVTVSTYYDVSHYYGYWWSSNGNIRGLMYNSPEVFTSVDTSSFASVFSIRCIRD
jgi:uncharacterized protein (TIGR02145 family)